MPRQSPPKRPRPEENSPGSRKGTVKRRLAVVAVFIVLIAAVVALIFLLSGKSEASPVPVPTPSPTASAVPDSSAWKLVVVSASTPLPRDFTVDLEALGIDGQIKVDTRILPLLKQLLNDANNADAGFTVCSGYRNVSKQGDLHEREIMRCLARGLDYDAAQIEAERYVQPPGGSEHHTGLAIDVLAPGEGDLSEDFAETAAGKWLAEHAQYYGFILRYPEGKEELTGIAWEPWHYRYVGSQIAQIITANDICLEEYVADPTAYKLPEPSPPPEKEAAP